MPVAASQRPGSQTEWGVMFVSHGRHTSLCLAVIFSFFVPGSSTLFAQSTSTPPASIDVAATTELQPPEPSTDTFLLAGDLTSSITQSEINQNSTEPSAVLSGNFFQRLVEYYRKDWNRTLPAAVLAPRRALPAPLDSSSFASADW